jgi:hypothetical protein
MRKGKWKRKLEKLVPFCISEKKSPCIFSPPLQIFSHPFELDGLNFDHCGLALLNTLMYMSTQKGDKRKLGMIWVFQIMVVLKNDEKYRDKALCFVFFVIG